MFRRFNSPESDPPHKIMRYWFYYSIWLGFSFQRPRWSGGNVLYHSCTSFEGASRLGQSFNIFTWFIGAGGLMFRSSWFLFRRVHICGVAYLANEHGFSVESSLQGISSNSSLWKRNNSSVVILTSSWSGKPAANAGVRLREANAERRHFIFPYGFGICSEDQNVEESPI